MPVPTITELRSHEEHRWSYMNSDQLQTRLGRIRNPDKLACFIAMAFRSHGPDGRLERLAWRRAEQLGVGSRVRTTMSAYNLRFTDQVRTPYRATAYEPYNERSERLRREAARRNVAPNDHARPVIRVHASESERREEHAANTIQPVLGYGEAVRADGIPDRIDAQTHLLGNWDDPDIDPEPDTKPEPKKKVKRRVIRFKRKARQLQLKSILNEE